ncbi:hypothetical protein K9N68_37330 (plasmid) [Kovacikia minuta CCNUW1]|uniref:hypothetical protein n=1 Tax=Kovacikia minuta TaxID=2931930 RepID=UPI001CCF3ED4|nr:hypothetical protein [Kovacikia minuta]UBF29876.1 hypothetical protein K9N68_37330 [Kovacikia minuta CCNUW1]
MEFLSHLWFTFCSYNSATDVRVMAILVTVIGYAIGLKAERQGKTFMDFVQSREYLTFMFFIFAYSVPRFWSFW